MMAVALAEEISVVERRRLSVLEEWLVGRWQGHPLEERAIESDPSESQRAEASTRTVATDPLALLEEVAGKLASLREIDWHALPGRAGHDALDQVELLDRLVAGVRSQVVAAVDADGLWALDGSRTFAAWLRQRTGATAGAASREVRETRALRDHLPLTAAALANGQISPQHVSALVREALTTQRLRDQLREAELGEAFLVTEARGMDAGTFTTLVKAWATSVDPEAADRRWRDDDAKEALTFAPTLGGYHVAGWLNDTSGQLVRTALEAHMGRKGPDDDRTPSQRRASALTAMARESLDRGKQGAGARVRPHITVTVPIETLRALANATGSAVPTAPEPFDGAGPTDVPGETGATSPTRSPGMADAGDPSGDPCPADGPGPIDDPCPADDAGPPDDAGPADGTGPVDAAGPFGGPGPVDHQDPAPGASAEAALAAPGGPRDSHAADPSPQAPFELSPEARAWVENWRPGDTHVISTTIDHDVMRGTEPATLENGTPVPPGLLARLVCESGLSRVVFGAESTVLDVGREKRIFPANQAKAIIARDRHCRYPGCDEPPGFGEIHHSIWWAKDNGPTSVEHGILLCWHHHDWVHARQVTITRSRGAWHFTDRNGRAITGTGPPAWMDLQLAPDRL